MQTWPRDLSRLRQKLIQLYGSPVEDLGPFLSEAPLVKGTVYPLRRKCSKPSCRCAGGDYHATVVLTASIAGKTRLWTIPEDRREELRQKVERYRQFRKARSTFLKKVGRRRAQMLGLINAIEKLRTRPP